MYNSQRIEVLVHNFQSQSLPILIILPKLFHWCLSSLGSRFHPSTAEFDVYSRPWPGPNSFWIQTQRRCLILSWNSVLPYFVPRMACFSMKICYSFQFWAVQMAKKLLTDMKHHIFSVSTLFWYFPLFSIWQGLVELSKLAWRQRIAAVIHAWPSSFPGMRWVYVTSYMRLHTVGFKLQK